MGGYAEITIGGELKKSKVKEFIEALNKDYITDYTTVDENAIKHFIKEYSSGNDFFSHEDGKETCFCHDDDSANDAMFEETEKACVILGLHYYRSSGPYEDMDAEESWYTGKDIPYTTEMDRNGYPRIFYKPMLDMVKATKDIKTLEDAALKVASGTHEEKNYSKYILEKGIVDPTSYLLEVLEKANPTAPDIPAFKIVEG